MSANAGTVSVNVTVQGIEQLKSQLLGTSQAFKGFGSGIQGADAATKGFESSSQRLKSSVQGTSLNLRSMASDMDSSSTSTKATATSMSQLAADTSKAKDSVMQTGQAAEEAGGRFGRLKQFTQQWGDVLTGAISSASGMLVFSTMLKTSIEEASGMQEQYNQQVAKAEGLQAAYNEAVAKYGEGSKEAVKAAEKYNDALDGLAYTERNLRFAQGDVTTMMVMFGTSIMGLATGTIPSLIKAIQKVREAKKGMAKAASDVVESLDSVDYTSRKSSESLKKMGKSVNIKPVATDLRQVDANMTKMSKSADKAAKSSKNLGTSMQFTGALSNLNGISVGMEGVEKSSGRAATGIRAMGGAIKTALIASGIGIAITGAITLLEAFSHNWWGLRDAINGAGKAIGDFLPWLKPVLDGLSWVGNEITKVFGGTVPEAAAQTEESLKKIDVKAAETGESFEYLEDLAKQSAESMPKYVQEARDKINSSFSQMEDAGNSAISGLVDAFREGDDEFEDAIDEMEDKIGIKFGKAMENMITEGTALADIKGKTSEALNLVVGLLDVADHPEEKAALIGYGKKIIEELEGGMKGQSANTQAIMAEVIRQINSAFNNIQDPVKFKTHMSNANTLLGTLGQSAQSLTTPLSNLNGKFDASGGHVSTFGQQISPIPGTLNDIYEKAFLTGVSISDVGTQSSTAAGKINSLTTPLGLSNEQLKEIAKSNAPNTIGAFGFQAGQALNKTGNLVGVGGKGPLPQVATNMTAISGTDAASKIAAAGTAASNAKGPFDEFAVSVTNGFNALSKWASDAAKGAFDSLSNLFNGGMDNPSEFSQGLIDRHNQTPITPGPGINFNSGMMPKGGLRNDAGGFLGGGGGSMPDPKKLEELKTLTAGVKQAFADMAAGIRTSLTQVSTDILGTGKAIAVFSQVAAGWGPKISQSFVGMATGIRTALVQVGTDLLGTGKAIAVFAQVAAGWMPKISANFQTMANTARTALVRIGTDILGLSRGIVAFSAGIAQTATKVGQSFTAMANGARQGMVKMGQDIIGLSRGIVAFRDGVAQTASRVASSIRSMASSFGSSMNQLISRANSASSAVSRLRNEINALKSKSITITVTTRYRTIGRPAAGSRITAPSSMEPGFGLASAPSAGVHSNTSNRGHELTMPPRITIDTKFEFPVILNGREIQREFAQKMFDNSSALV